VFLWVALLGVLAKVMMRGRPISLKSMQQQQQQQQKQRGEQFHVAQEHLCA